MFVLRTKLCVVLLLGGAFLLGCEKSATPEATVDALASVNGSDISQADLDFELNRILGERSELLITEEINTKALESLVMTRAISMKQEKLLDAAAIAELNRKVQRYKETLLVESYLRENAEPYVPTGEDVKAYYENNKSRFTEEAIYTYEVLRAAKKPDSSELPKILQTLSGAGKQEDWRQYSSDLKSKGYSIAYFQGRSDLRPGEKELHDLVKTLVPGQVSDVAMTDGVPLVTRAISVQPAKTVPLQEVGEEIRKILATNHMRNAIKGVAEKVIAEAEVKYWKDNLE